MHNFITINDRRIGKDIAPYIIAEMSANHNSNINKGSKDKGDKNNINQNAYQGGKGKKC